MTDQRLIGNGPRRGKAAGSSFVSIFLAPVGFATGLPVGQGRAGIRNGGSYPQIPASTGGYRVRFFFLS
jgi:hypothetical protein